ncbi:cupin [Kribbella shirazensis]|uniref:Ethanolamine utilization protein EutQ (Cupin superfamily) n=1 Tax=Kribbella shirazensis TaxID=1105143 RepID=A0A7X5V7D5_9ACTN|nr:cupin [Kribbella shirazensis]NIK55993.1 ethanolamine utilization protein EutQ (cupin superfamily) [Kribbella shirazensis]
MRVHKISNGDGAWTAVGDRRIFVNDLIDAATHPHARMTVGFARLDKGESMDITFPYDEVLIVTKGSYAVRTAEGETLYAAGGEVLYLPAGTSSSSWAEEDTEIVYVASPPDVYAAHVAASVSGQP